VFEALRTEFVPRNQAPVIRGPDAGTPTSSLMVSPSDGEDAEEATRTVWSASDPATYSESDEDLGNPVPTQEALDQPSLGYLDDVLGFLAAEREKLQRKTGQRNGVSSQSQASTSESARRHVIEPRRKRRRKKTKVGTSATGSASMTHVDIDHDADADAEGAITPVGDMLDGSSSGEYWVHGKSMPSTPPRPNRHLRTVDERVKGKEPVTATTPGSSSKVTVQPKLTHSRSTPSLRVSIPSPPDAGVLRLRTLATKLRMLFVHDAKTLSSVLLNDGPEDDGFIDPRGRPANDEDPLVHVFIDQQVFS
jgi:hypothetical protein